MNEMLEYPDIYEINMDVQKIFNNRTKIHVPECVTRIVSEMLSQEQVSFFSFVQYHAHKLALDVSVAEITNAMLRITPALISTHNFARPVEKKVVLQAVVQDYVPGISSIEMRLAIIVDDNDEISVAVKTRVPGEHIQQGEKLIPEALESNTQVYLNNGTYLFFRGNQSTEIPAKEAKDIVDFICEGKPFKYTETNINLLPENFLTAREGISRQVWAALGSRQNNVEYKSADVLALLKLVEQQHYCKLVEKHKMFLQATGGAYKPIARVTTAVHAERFSHEQTVVIKFVFTIVMSHNQLELKTEHTHYCTV